MAIGGALIEMLTEGVVFRWLSSIWTALRDGARNEIVQNFVKNKLTPEGLDDENIFSHILSMSKYKDGDKEKGKLRVPKGRWELLFETIAKMDNEDYVNKTHYMKNFRIIIAIDAIGRGQVKVSIPDKNDPKKIVKIIEEPDPKYVRAGVSILQDMVLSCSTENEFRSYMLMIGAMQDAPFGTMDEMMQWAKTVGLPFLHQTLINTSDAIINASAAIEHHYQDLDNNWERARAMSWWTPIAKLIALFRAM